MDKPQLEAMLAEIDARFAAQRIKHDQDEARATESEHELFKIQGEWRFTSQLIKDFTQENLIINNSQIGQSFKGVEQFSTAIDYNTPAAGDTTSENQKHIDAEPRVAKLHEVDKSGIPAEAQVVRRGNSKHGE